MPIDNTERDSTSPEDIAPDALQRLVLPEDWTSYDLFSCAVSQEAFRGWVKQPSPLCAAAALAGALNVVYGYPRTHVQAYTSMDILSVYREQFNDLLTSQRRQLSAAIGNTALTTLEVLMQSALHAQNLDYGGVGSHRVTKRVLRRCIQECLSSIIPSYTALDVSSGDESIDTDDFDDAVAEQVDNGPVTPTSRDVAPHPCPQGIAPLSDPQLTTLLLYFHRMDGLAKLCRPDKPSTAICGNATLLNAASYVHSTSDAVHRVKCLRATCLMGQFSPNCKLRIAITPTDSPGKQTLDWKVLWNTFTDDHTALVVHLKNHYAMVFALREWKDPSTKEWTRQILTARRGQRPSSWVNWSELRHIFLGWTGYKLLAFAGSTGDE